MRVLYVLIIVLMSLSARGQILKPKVYKLSNPRDIYVADVVLKRKVFSDKCTCQAVISDTCSLFEGRVENLRYVADVETVLNKDSLKAIRFFLAEAVEGLQEGQAYTLTLSLGSNYTYLKVNSVLTLGGEKDWTFIHESPFLTGFFICHDIGWFKEFLVSLKLLKPANAFSEKNKVTDRFDGYIRNNTR